MAMRTRRRSMREDPSRWRLGAISLSSGPLFTFHVSVLYVVWAAIIIAFFRNENRVLRILMNWTRWIHERCSTRLIESKLLWLEQRRSWDNPSGWWEMVSRISNRQKWELLASSIPAVVCKHNGNGSHWRLWEGKRNGIVDGRSIHIAKRFKNNSFFCSGQARSDGSREEHQWLCW